MPYSAKSIANYFLDLANASGELLSPMKIQKLVYYAVGWFAGYTGQALAEDPVEAWQYGPVFPSLYHEFKGFGSSAITRKAKESNAFHQRDVPVPDNAEVRKFLDNIWASYSRFSGIDLSEMTHAANSPWHKTWTSEHGDRNAQIPHNLITEHFRQAADTATQKATS